MARCSVACVGSRPLNGRHVSGGGPLCLCRPSALNPPSVKHKTALLGNLALTASRDAAGPPESDGKRERETLLELKFSLEIRVVNRSASALITFCC